nr:hypothetical protein Q903MT_gene751 [Picea sitchensis]
MLRRLPKSKSGLPSLYKARALAHQALSTLTPIFYNPRVRDDWANSSRIQSPSLHYVEMGGHTLTEWPN